MNVTDLYLKKYLYSQIQVGDKVIPIATTEENWREIKFNVPHIVEEITTCHPGVLESCEKDGAGCPSKGICFIIKPEIKGASKAGCRAIFTNEEGRQLK